MPTLTVVQTASLNFTGATSPTISFANPVGVGNTVILVVGGPGEGEGAVTMTATGTGLTFNMQSPPTSGTTTSYLFIATGATTGAKNMTVTTTGSAICATALEVHGLIGTPAVTYKTWPTSGTSLTQTVTTPGQLAIVSYDADDVSSTTKPGNPWIVPYSTASHRPSIAYQFATTPAAITAAWTGGSDNPVLYGIVIS